MEKQFVKIGAILYALWGLYHFYAAYNVFNQASSLQANIIQARVSQGAFFILGVGIASLLVAIFLNWKNSLVGYWANLMITTYTDIGLLTFIIFPGLGNSWVLWIGPILWILAMIFSTIGIRSRSVVT